MIIERRFFKPDLLIIGLILLFAVINIFLKFSFFSLVFSTDSQEYIEVGKFFDGQPTEVKPHRLLKPLAPFLVAVISKITSGDMISALMIEAIIFYLAGGLAIYFLIKKFFENNSWLAFLGSLFYLGSYPMLKYGLDLMIDTGAWFFYVFGVYLAFCFFKEPNRLSLIFACLIAVFGFLWKEYSALNLALLGLLIIFHPKMTTKEKTADVLFLVSIFLVVWLPWQIFVYSEFDYSYFDWYQSGSPFSKVSEYNLYHIGKSLFGTLLAGWFLVIFGLKFWREFSFGQRYFLKFLIPVAFLFLLWGAVSSRLYYVIAPGLIIFVLVGVEKLTKKMLWQIAIVLAAIVPNYVWLILNNTKQILF